MIANSNYTERIHHALLAASFPATPPHLYDPIRYILSLSGKRIRPLLVYLGVDLFDPTALEAATPAAIAIEYFHNFSLIHDDIMDKAPLRRGQQTVHRKWNDNIAILSGDALLVQAYVQLAACPEQHIPSLLRIFNTLAIEVCEGQQYDMDFEERTDVSEAEYIEMIRLKTSVLLGGALQMGAIIADASPENQQLLYDFGVNLGIAFQLQDDILDVYGDPQTFGKQVGGDILSNKKTLLHIHLKALLTAADQAEFEDVLALGEDESDRKIQQMKDLYARYDVLSFARQRKEYFTSIADSCLAAIDLPAQNKVLLYDLANTLMHRTQ